MCALINSGNIHYNVVSDMAAWFSMIPIVKTEDYGNNPERPLYSIILLFRMFKTNFYVCMTKSKTLKNLDVFCLKQIAIKIARVWLSLCCLEVARIISMVARVLMVDT